jgi:hypothetical protein
MAVREFNSMLILIMVYGVITLHTKIVF